MTRFKIPNFWRERNPRARILPIVSLQLHPKDIGSLLVGYSEGAVIYSFKQNKPLKYFHYEIPRGAQGGDSDSRAANEVRMPRLTHAIWHPTGTFVLTAHEDSSLVFWDPRDGRAIEARTLQETGINVAGKAAWGASVDDLSLKRPYLHISWCSKENPDDTGLLVAGGTPTIEPSKGLTFFDFGHTPNYQTSSWDVLTQHFRSPKRVHVLPTPPGAEIADLILVPKSSPHYGSSNNPMAVLTLLSSGEVVTMSFPSGHPISPTNMLHIDLAFVHPFVTKTALAGVERNRWLGMREVRQHGPNFLLGGVEATRPMKRFEKRNIVQTAHADGTIRVWDAGQGDEIGNGIVLQVDLARAIGRWDNVDVSTMSLSGAAGELSVGLRTGEMAIFRLGRNQNAGRPEAAPGQNEGPGRMTSISHRADPALKEGMVPVTLTNDQQGTVTALKHSDVGFVAVGYQSGGVTMIDMRGPAIVYTKLLHELERSHRRGSIRGHPRGSSNAQDKPEWPTTIEFGVMDLDGDEYSSILLFVGTSLGRVATFKILPGEGGKYSVQFAGIATLGARIVSICPINANSGAPAYASQPAVGGLRNGTRTNGVLVVITTNSAHIFKPTSAKGAQKTFDAFLCDSATVACFEDRGYALVGLFGDGRARAFSLPSLKEVGSARVDNKLDVKRFGDAILTPTGDIFGWTGPSEVALLNVWGAGLDMHSQNIDRLYNPQAVMPPRPTISNLQWMAGTQYITPADMDMLIGGPDRPPSKRMIAEMREMENQARLAERQGRTPPPGTRPPRAGSAEETYWAYMQRQMQERTEQLGLTGDSMDRTAEASEDWSEGVSNFVAKQKRNMVMGAIGSKFGF